MERSGRRERIRALITGLAMAAASLSLTVTTASASTTGGGIFEGIVTLPSFPCTNCTGGAFAGSATLSLSGLATSTMDGLALPYTAAWTGLNNASAVLIYDESCFPQQPGDTFPPEGTANGTFIVTGGLLSIAGGQPLSATLSGSLSWLRVGVAAQMTVSDLTITAPSGGSTVAVNLTNTLLVGQSGDAFMWTNGPGTCATTQANQTAVVAGIALQPA